MPLTDDDLGLLDQQRGFTASFVKFLGYFCQHNPVQQRLLNRLRFYEKLKNFGLNINLHQNQQRTFVDEVWSHVSTANLPQLKNAIKREGELQNMKLQMEQCMMNYQHHPLSDKYQTLMGTEDLTDNDINSLRNDLKQGKSFQRWYQASKNHQRNLQDALGNNINPFWNTFLRNKTYHTENLGKHATEALIDRLNEKNPELLTGIEDLISNFNNTADELKELFEYLQDEVNGEGIISETKSTLTDLRETFQGLTKKKGDPIDPDNETGEKHEEDGVFALLTSLLKEFKGDGENNPGVATELKNTLTDLRKDIKETIRRIKGNIPNVHALVDNANKLLTTYRQIGDDVRDQVEDVVADIRDAVHDGTKFASEFKETLGETSSTVRKAVLTGSLILIIIVAPTVAPSFIATIGIWYVPIVGGVFIAGIAVIWFSKPFFNALTNLHKVRTKKMSKSLISHPLDWFKSQSQLKSKYKRLKKDLEHEKKKGKDKKDKTGKLSENSAKEILHNKITGLQTQKRHIIACLNVQKRNLQRLQEKIEEIHGDNEKRDRLQKEINDLQRNIEKCEEELAMNANDIEIAEEELRILSNENDNGIALEDEFENTNANLPTTTNNESGDEGIEVDINESPSNGLQDVKVHSDATITSAPQQSN